jgi:hypothetical protein
VAELGAADGEAEGSRGLQLVERLSVRWGWRRRSGQAVTWYSGVADFLSVVPEEALVPDASFLPARRTGAGEARLVAKR